MGDVDNARPRFRDQRADFSAREEHGGFDEGFDVFVELNREAAEEAGFAKAHEGAADFRLEDDDGELLDSEGLSPAFFLPRFRRAAETLAAILDYLGLASTPATIEAVLARAAEHEPEAEAHRTSASLEQSIGRTAGSPSTSARCSTS